MQKSAIVLLLLATVSSVSVAQSAKSHQLTGTESAGFDIRRDPEKDLHDAIVQAQKTHRRILLDVGGEWCVWCHRLDACFKEQRDVAYFLRNNYIIVKVNYSKENRNQKFLSRYPKIEGYPHLFVLETDGSLIHSQDTGLLESGDHHDPRKVLAFLKAWSPASSHN